VPHDTTSSTIHRPLNKFPLVRSLPIIDVTPTPLSCSSFYQWYIDVEQKNTLSTICTHNGSKAPTPDRCYGNRFAGAGSRAPLWFSHTTMIHDGAPLRVFRISELTRVIASQLILTSQESAVNLACTCRCLEEPVLGTLWETQQFLSTLLEVLPKANWDIEGTMGNYTVRGLDLPEGGPSA